MSGACGGGGDAPAKGKATGATTATTIAAAVAPSALDTNAVCGGLDPAPSNPVLGALPRTAAPLVGDDLEGGRFDLAAQRGKAVLVSFASSWDALTKQERPTFKELRRAVGDDLVIVRVVSESSLERALADYLPIEGYRTLLDQERACSPLGAFTNSWGVKAVPESFLVDRAGNVRFYFINKRDWSTPDAIACVRALLADTTPAIAVPPLGARAPEECPPPPPPPPPPPSPSPSGAAVSGEIRGTISFARATKRKAKPGVIFLLVKQADASGQPTGMPLAVDRLQYDGAPIAFVLDQSKQMVAGPAITGDVVLVARWDQDGDAMTKQPGDITGTLRVTAPARDVKVVLDTVLP